MNSLVGDGSIIRAAGLAGLRDNSDIDSGGRGGDSDSLGNTLAVTITGAGATVVGSVAGAVASTLGALPLTLASAVAVVTAGSRVGLTDALNGLGDGASLGLGGGSGGIILGGTVTLGAVIGDLRASRDSDGGLESLVDCGSDGLVTLGKSDNLLGGVVGNDGLVALLRGGISTASGHGDGSGVRGSEGLASNATGLSIVKDGGVDRAGVSDGADNLGEDDGVSLNVGDLVGLGELSNGSVITSRAVGDGRSAAGNGLDDSGLDGQSGLGVGAVVAAVVGVVGEVVGVGHGGKHADGSDDGLHFEDCDGLDVIWLSGLILR